MKENSIFNRNKGAQMWPCSAEVDHRLLILSIVFDYMAFRLDE